MHCLHHFLPTIPFSRYHKAWKIGKDLLERQNIPVRGVFTPVKNIIFPEEEGLGLQHRVRVSQSYLVADDVRAFELLPADGEQLAPFKPGSHIDVEIQEGLTRQYSLCNSSSDTQRYLIAVKKEPTGRGGSKALHETIKEGQCLRISTPRNNFPLTLDGKNYLLIGGGIGLTPLLFMSYELHKNNLSFELHLCARSERYIPFKKHLKSFPFFQHIYVHLDDGDEDQKLNLSALLDGWFSGRKFYVCGPSGFMSQIISEAVSCGWPDSSVRSETFTPRRITHLENRDFEVFLARSNKTLTVKANEQLIDILNSNDCAVPCSCMQGVCGSCVTPVLEGDVDHRDAVLSDTDRESNTKMCVCVGRAKGKRLVLDI